MKRKRYSDSYLSDVVDLRLLFCFQDMHMVADPPLHYNVRHNTIKIL